mgnify:CR=1 FL=1
MFSFGWYQQSESMYARVYSYKSEQHCLVTIKEISEYVNEDFLEREIGIYLQCVKEETNHVNI